MPNNKTDCKAKVLDELTRHGIKSRAAKKAGVTRQTINRWRANDPVFRAACDAAVEEGCE
jgi:hypothetical protein